VLAFGGQVMKNVAGYDVSRLLAGSLGTLGILLEVSLKVMPRPLAEASLRFEMDEAEALERLNAWAGQPLPISASAWADGVLHLRLSGAEAAVRAAAARLGGERLADGEAEAFWIGVREQQAPAFAREAAAAPLWRISLPSVAPPLQLAGRQLIEWGGALRWRAGEGDAGKIRHRASELGGHATLFRSGERADEVFQPPVSPLMALHRRLKAAFDPAGIFNPGRLYREL
jgi:glycolate oxidase FAD binding subunit